MNKKQKEQAVLGLPDEYINILKKAIYYTSKQNLVLDIFNNSIIHRINLLIYVIRDIMKSQNM